MQNDHPLYVGRRVPAYHIRPSDGHLLCSSTLFGRQEVNYEREDYMRRQEADHALLDMRTRKPFDSDRNRMAQLGRDLTNATPAFDAEAYRPAEIVHKSGDYLTAYAPPQAEAPTPATEQYEYWSEAETGTYRLTTGQFLLASVVVIMGAIALVL